MFRQAWIALIAAVLVSIPSLVLARTWTSRDGRRIEADYVNVDETAVTLRKSDGKEVKVKLELLADEDQAFLRGILARKAAKGDTGKAKSDPDNPFESAGSKEEEDSPFETLPGMENKATISKTTDKVGKSSEVPGWMNDDDDEPAGKSTKKMKPENRTWEDKNGQKTTGKFVRIVGNEVVILRSGRQIRTDYWQLSSDDQEYVKDLLTANGLERQIPRIDPSTVAARNTTPGAMPAPAGIPAMPAAGITPPTGIPAMPRTAMPPARYTTAPTFTPPPAYQASTTPMIPSATMPSATMPSAMPSSTIPDYPRVTSRNMPSATYMPPMSTPTIPTYNAPSMPAMPSGPVFVTQKQCMKCGAVLPDHFTAGNSCPKCGVYFARDETNGRTDYTGGFRLSSPRLLIRGIVSLGVLAVTGISFCVWLATGRKS